MAADNALFTHTGSTDAQHARLAMGGLIAVQGPSALDIRTGVLVAPGSRSLITGTSSTGPMKVSVAAHQWVTSRGAANGPYLGKLAAATLVDIAVAPGSGTRVDVVWDKQQDSTLGVPSPDGVTAPQVGVTTGVVGQGKPAIPVGASELGTVTVTAGATRTDSAGVTIAQTARQTAARGARIPVLDAADRDGITPYRSLPVYRLDLGREQVYGSDDKWHGVGSGPMFETAWPNSVDTAGTNNIPTGTINVPAQGVPYKLRCTAALIFTARRAAGITADPELQLLVNGAISDRDTVRGVAVANANYNARLSRTLQVADGAARTVVFRLDIPAGVNATTYVDASHTFASVEVDYL